MHTLLSHSTTHKSNNFNITLRFLFYLRASCRADDSRIHTTFITRESEVYTTTYFM